MPVDVVRLREICEQHTVQSSVIDMENVTDLLALSDTHNAPYVRTHCLKYLAKTCSPADLLAMSQLTPAVVREIMEISQAMKKNRYAEGWMQFI